MSKASRDPKGDVFSQSTRAAMNGDVPRVYVNNPPSTLPQLLEQDAELRHSIDQLVNDDDGYLKMRRSSLSSDLHLTWTFTANEYSGSYVYVRVDYWQVHDGLELLLGKMRAVRLGQLRPTPDKRRYKGD